MGQFKRSIAWRLLPLAGALLALAMGGCAQFWDDVTCRPFSPKRILMPDPDPMVVLHESDNANDRARALRRLTEPKEHGGKDEDQRLVLDILSTAATSDNHVYSRICAIAALSHFKDPRAVQILQAAYYSGNKLENPEQKRDVECAALKALGETANPDAIDLLVVALRQPPSDYRDSEQVKLQRRQLRITAARALGNFHQKQATDALLEVLQKERDVAMLDRARDSLCEATGKKYPNEYKVWDQYLNHPEKGVPPEDGFDVKFASWLGVGKGS